MSDKPSFVLFKNTELDPYSLSGAEEYTFKKNSAVLLPSGIALVSKGRIKVTSKENGVPLNEIGEGGMLGASTLFAEHKAGTELIAGDKGAQVIFIPQEEFAELLRQNRQLLQNYLGFVSSRICFLNGKLNTLSSQNAESKLLRHIAQNGGSVKIKSMTELAKMLSIGRASLYRVLEELEGENKIKRNGKELSLI